MGRHGYHALDAVSVLEPGGLFKVLFQAAEPGIQFTALLQLLVAEPVDALVVQLRFAIEVPAGKAIDRAFVNGCLHHVGVLQVLGMEVANCCDQVALLVTFQNPEHHPGSGKRNPRPVSLPVDNLAGTLHLATHQLDRLGDPFGAALAWLVHVDVL